MAEPVDHAGYVRERITEALLADGHYTFVDGELKPAPNLDTNDVLRAYGSLLAALVDITSTLAAEIDRLRHQSAPPS